MIFLIAFKSEKKSEREWERAKHILQTDDSVETTMKVWHLSLI